MRIEFEACGLSIVVRNGTKVVMRCRSRCTDLGYEENLDDFVQRHGGIKKTIEYLHTRLGNFDYDAIFV